MTTYRGTRLEKPLPAHAMTPNAEEARASVREYGRRREAARLEALAAEKDAAGVDRQAWDSALLIDLDTLTGSPKATAANLASTGARVVATQARDGHRLSVWAVMRPCEMSNGEHRAQRVRAMYRRTATGWGSDGVIIDGLAYRVTAALSILTGDGSKA